MKASLFAQMGYSQRHRFPATWPVPPSQHDPALTMRSYQEGMEQCELAEELGFDWISCSEHHYSGNRLSPNPALLAAAVAQRCRRVKIALLGQLLQHHNPVRAAEEIGMLDNLTGGRVIMAFLRGVPSEDLPYSLNPAEGRARLLEGMDLVLRALTEPQPFSWEGRYYQFRTVSVCPRPVQQPLPPVIVATRSEEMVRYAACHRLGLAISYDPIDQVAAITQRYRDLCREAGWQPGPDQVVYRASILLAKTDQAAAGRLEELRRAGMAERGMDLRPSLTRAVLAAREGREPPPPGAGAGGGRPRREPITYLGSPETVLGQLRELHERCGVGVVDLGFQHAGLGHEEVMGGIRMFGEEVLPRLREF